MCSASSEIYRGIRSGYCSPGGDTAAPSRLVSGFESRSVALLGRNCMDRAHGTGRCSGTPSIFAARGQPAVPVLRYSGSPRCSSMRRLRWRAPVLQTMRRERRDHLQAEVRRVRTRRYEDAVPLHAVRTGSRWTSLLVDALTPSPTRSNGFQTVPDRGRFQRSASRPR